MQLFISIIGTEVTDPGYESAICLEIFMDLDDARRLKCAHVFHTSCIDAWYQNHHTDCPLCKSVFIPNK